MSKKMICKEIQLILCELKPNIKLYKYQSLIQENIIDSLEFFSLIAMLSEQFKIEFCSEDLSIENFHTVDTIANIVLKKLEKKNV